MQVGDSLLEEAERSYAEGGIELYLSMMMAPGDVPLSSSLLVSYTPRPAEEPTSLDDVARALGSGAPDPKVEVASSEVASLPAGSAIRRLAHRRTGPEGDEVVSLVLDWHVPVPRGRGALLSLSFATPMLTLEEALVPMFDAVAETLRFAPAPDQEADRAR